MKLKFLIIVLILTGFLSCSKKKKFIEYGNRIILINPFENFRTENVGAGYLYFDNNCTLTVSDDKGNSFDILTFPDDLFGEIPKDIDWYLYDEIDPTKKVTFSTNIRYISNWDAIYNGYATEYEYGNYTYSITKEIEPNRIYRWDPKNNTFEDTGQYQSENNDNSDNCFVGTWKKNISDCNTPGAEMIYNFRSDGTGTYQNVIVSGYGDQCTILCTVIFYFNWTDNGDGTIHFEYTDISNDCGQNPAVPNSENLTAVCNGSTATIGIREFTRY